MKILVFADLHGCPTENEMRLILNSNVDYDVCVTLGDNPANALNKIKHYNGNKPLFGVVGNHDDWQTLERANINDIHGKVIRYGGIRFAGIGGSNRYKNGNFAMLTQEESIAISKVTPPADILISHETMYLHFTDAGDPVHCGLKGINNYIRQNKIKLNICGHHHINSVTNDIDGCTIICVYGCAIVDTSVLTTNIVF